MNSSESDTALRDERLKWIMYLQDFVTSQPTEITEFDDKLVRRPIAKITVFEERFGVEIKSGENVEIKG